MSNRLYRYAHKVLLITQIVGLVATGALAISMTHMYCTVSFGNEPPKSFDVAVNDAMRDRLAVALPMNQFIPEAPKHKPAVHP